MDWYMTNQKPRGIPEEVPAEPAEEIKEAPPNMAEEDTSELPHPMKKRRAGYLLRGRRSSPFAGFYVL